MIHQYKLSGYSIVLDIGSGSVHAVSDLAYDAIALLDSGMSSAQTEDELLPKYTKTGASHEEIRECLSEIEELIDEGKLFSDSDYEPLADELKERSRGIVKALCLHIAHTCNLNCSYCFASQGNYKGKRELMSFETGKRALDFLIENSGSRRNLEVDFFGGEPLMNFEVMKQLVAYARSIEDEHGKNFRFTLTTNGILIDDGVIDFANREMSNVVLSLDGRREVHDRFRIDMKGRGSWDRIVPKFQKMVEARADKEYYMRGTFTHLNTDFVKDIETMLELGFTELSLEPVVCDKDDPLALSEEDKAIVLQQYEELAELMIKRRREGRPFTFYHYMIDLDEGPCIYKRISGCGAGTEYMAVTPSGDLFPCHQFVGEENFKLGDIWQGVVNTALQNEFATCNVYARPECADCWAKFYCSGGCAANAFHASGSILGSYEYGCDIFRKRIECAIMLEVSRFEDEEAQE
ncbi:MAG: thioether cross-link-forming SCIFF peptide maturase [Clostridiales bacterium]|nr:thioether cross-link-forming SCIFF peptide maturase [Clostridiales bacterium]